MPGISLEYQSGDFRSPVKLSLIFNWLGFVPTRPIEEQPVETGCGIIHVIPIIFSNGCTGGLMS